MQSAAGLQVVRMMQSHLENGAVRPTAPPSGVYRTADGFLSVTVVRPAEWQGFCAAIERDDLAANDTLSSHPGRLAAQEELWPLFRAALATHSNAQWSARLTERRIMHEAINAYGDFLAHPHVQASGAVAWIDHPHVPQPLPLPNIIGLPAFASGSPRALAPGLGQHTREILHAHGFADPQITTLADAGVIGIGR